ncbi:rho termination factor, RNA-binding domain protein [Mycobacterium kansasii 824]|nr:rho termination factor, RNA-binding domain protein [Mycobacterium kansasii 824]
MREDDVLQPVAGILDVLDNYAFVRTSGYLAGPHDVYVSMNMVRKNGLRRGDAVTGAVRVPREGEAGDKNPRQKFNPWYAWTASTADRWKTQRSVLISPN